MTCKIGNIVVCWQTRCREWGKEGKGRKVLRRDWNTNDENRVPIGWFPPVSNVIGPLIIRQSQLIGSEREDCARITSDNDNDNDNNS